MPQYSAAAVYQACSMAAADPNLQQRLMSAANDVASADVAYDAAASAKAWYTLQDTSFELSGVTKPEAEANYTGRFAKKGSVGKVYYESLRLAARNGLCPLCGLSRATTLDHYLPKARFPALAVAPRNLVPACKDCNFAKKQYVASNAQDQTFHPYYDNVENVAWLGARVRVGPQATVEYFVQDPGGASQILLQRAAKHIEVFGLGDSFASFASEELGFIRPALDDLFVTEGPGAVQQSLLDDARYAAAYRVNHWKTALYRALSQSTWYFSGGFRY